MFQRRVVQQTKLFQVGLNLFHDPNTAAIDMYSLFILLNCISFLLTFHSFILHFFFTYVQRESIGYKLLIQITTVHTTYLIQ